MPTILKAPLQQESEAWFDRTLAGAFNLPVPKRRHVDDLHALPRQRQMRVICLGMPRTGTFSLFNALTRMGFKPYHMAAAMTKPAIDFPCWEEAIRAKYHGDGKPFEREDFDKILGDYDAILDAPGVMFPDELLKAYPEAKVIITERPVEDWTRSIKNTVAACWAWHWKPVAWGDPAVVSPYGSAARTMNAVMPLTSASNPSTEHKIPDFYKEHYRHVREICPKDRVLELRFGMGFKELCEFLEMDVIDEEYPKVNDSAFFVALHRTMWWDAAWKAATKVTGYTALACVGAVVVGRSFGYGRPSDALKTLQEFFR